MSDVESAQYFFGQSDGTAGILYDSALMPTQISFGNNTSQAIARDPMHRIRSITSSAGLTAFWSTGTYRYDGAGNIRNIGVSSESGFGVTVGAQEYWYDAVNRLVQAQTASQVNSPSGASTTTAYSYDLFGNMLSHQRTGGATVPTGYDWSNRTYSGNRATNHGYLYDSNGNTLRIIDTGGVTNGALWDDLNRMRVLVGGDPQSTAGVPSESYLFDVGGNRFARQDRRGYPIITVRDAGGQPLAEYTKKSSDNFPKLDRDFVYGAGKLLVERVVTGVVPHSMGTDPVRTGSAYNFSVDQGAGTGSYDIDIQTGSGYQNYVSGIQLGSGNSFTLAESSLSPNETNFVRIRGANPAITNYSQVVSVVYDPSISSSSQNPVRALSVSRSGTNVALKWEVAGTTTKKFRVYFRLADGSTTYLLSPVSLPSSTRTLTLSDQSLTQVCGDFFVKIVLSDSPLTESAASPYNRLGSAQSGITGPLNPCGGGSGSNPISYTFANSYHHRDHLGSLRAETDEAGNRSVKRDYYAFGIEMPNGFESSAQAATRRQFTEAERGVYNGLDYMMARFCSGNAGRFLSPDVVVGNTANPQSWNRYSFVMNSPMNYTDPSGKIYISPNQEAGPHGGNDPMTRTGSQERMGGYVTYFVKSKPPPGTTSTATPTPSEIPAYKQGSGTEDAGTQFSDLGGMPGGHRESQFVSAKEHVVNALRLMLSMPDIGYSLLLTAVSAANSVGMEVATLTMEKTESSGTAVLFSTVTGTKGQSDSQLPLATSLHSPGGWDIVTTAHAHPSGDSRPSGGGRGKPLGNDELRQRNLEAALGPFSSYIVANGGSIGRYTSNVYQDAWSTTSALAYAAFFAAFGPLR